MMKGVAQSERTIGWHIRHMRRMKRRASLRIAHINFKKILPEINRRKTAELQKEIEPTFYSWYRWQLRRIKNFLLSYVRSLFHTRVGA